MKKKLASPGLLLIIIVLCAGVAPALSAEESRVSFFVQPLLLKGLGGTAYDLKVYDPTTGQSGLSRLEFPMVSLEAGITAGLSIEKNGQRAWLFEASFAHSTLPWHANMNDYDWTGLSGFPPIPWSYTYSTDTTTSWRASAEAAWTFGSVGPLSLSLYATYHYQYASHVEDSLIGWQYVLVTPATVPPSYNAGWFSLPTSDVLEYTLTAHEPGLGLMADLHVISGLSLQLRVAFTPVYVSDSDDHKLRTKLSTASGWGAGVYADFRGRYQFPRYYKDFSTYIALDGELISYYVSTTQTQYWYGNADAANGTPQGTKYTGIGHVITSTQFQVGLSFGFEF